MAVGSSHHRHPSVFRTYQCVEPQDPYNNNSDVGHRLRLLPQYHPAASRQA